MPLRALGDPTATALTLRTPRAEGVGGWLAQARTGRDLARDRRGVHLLGEFLPASLFAQYGIKAPRPDRLLSTDQLWQVYWKTADVRACVDSIVRRIATWNWSVWVDLDPDDDRYGAGVAEAERVERFLAAPNRDGQTWQEVWTETGTDLLVFDAAVLELVRDRAGRLAELVPLRGDDVVPKVGEHGDVEGYWQTQTGVVAQGADLFAPDDLLVMHLFPTTSSAVGRPIIETVVDQAVTLILSSERLMLAMDADEVPPGLLVLGGLGGAAAGQAKADLESMRGRDHKIRVLGVGAGQSAVDVKWLELTRTLKDVDFVPVVDQIRRQVWRVFGVQPVEMGAVADVNRSTGQVQVDVSASHLITPILELIQAKVNARLVPLLVEDERVRPHVRFGFDFDQRLTTAEQKARADAFAVYVTNGVMTRNEVRVELGYHPIDGGDVATVEEGGALIAVEALAARAAPGDPARPQAPDVPETGPYEDDDDGGDTGPAPGEAEQGRHGRHGRVVRADDPDLPSDWQPAGRFGRVRDRVVDLKALARAVAGYVRDVQPLYDDAARETVAAIAGRWAEGGFTPVAAAAARADVSAALDRLAREWDATAEGRYVAAARVGRDAAARFTKDDPLADDWRARALAYQAAEMAHLVAADGLLGAVRARLHAVVLAVARDVPVEGRARGGDAAAPGLSPASTLAEVVAAGVHAWESHAHRVKNWAGALVELSQQLFGAGVLRAAPPPGSDGEPYAQWVSVLDADTCDDCGHEGRAGFRPLGSLRRWPGGAVRCRRRCRCVVVMWTKREVDTGEAVDLSGQ